MALIEFHCGVLVLVSEITELMSQNRVLLQEVMAAQLVRGFLAF
jgi:hypothetical protein